MPSSGLPMVRGHHGRLLSQGRATLLTAYLRLRFTRAGIERARAAIGRCMCSRINCAVVRRMSWRQYEASWMSS